MSIESELESVLGSALGTVRALNDRLQPILAMSEKGDFNSTVKDRMQVNAVIDGTEAESLAEALATIQVTVLALEHLRGGAVVADMLERSTTDMEFALRYNKKDWPKVQALMKVRKILAGRGAW